MIGVLTTRALPCDASPLGSAGASTLAGLKHFIAEPSTTRVLALINISLHGLAAAGCSGQGLGGELDALTHVSTAAAVDAAAANPDWVVGFKLRLSADCANDGKNEAEAYARALAAAGAAKLPLMVHHTFSSVPLNGAGGCPSALRAGDIYTHTLHGFPSTLIEKDPASEGGCVRYQFTAAAKEARARGVLFDVGHGAGSFSWTAAEVGAAEGFLPDIISTDLHLDCCEGPAYDLPTVMTKFLHVGMPLLDVIRAVTSTPAAAIGWADRVGSLAPGRAADISVFKLDKPEGGVQIEDCQSQLRTVSEVLKCVAVWKDGTKCTVTQADSFPLNQETLKRGAQAWSRLLVRDPKQWSNLAC